MPRVTDQRQPGAPVVWIPISVFLALAIGVTVPWALARHSAAATVRAETALLSDQLAGRLEGCVATRISMLSEIAREWRAGGLRSTEAMSQRIGAQLATFPGYQAINVVSATGVITRVHPRVGNERALGQDLSKHPIAHAILEQARQAGEPRVTQPLELYQGGVGFAAYVPLVDDQGNVGGFLNGVFRSDDLVMNCLSGGSGLGEYDCDISDGGDRVFGRSGDPEALRESRMIRIANRVWHLALSLTTDSADARSGPGAIVLGFALVGCLLFSSLLGLLLTGRARRHAERVRNRAEHQRLQRRLYQAQKMEALGRLAGGVAHDFNNLLTVITLNVSEARALESHSTEQLDEISLAADRAAELTAQLMALGKREPGVLGPVYLEHIIAGLQPLLARLLRESVELRIDIASELPSIVGNTVMLEQILLNLLLNGSDAMPDGGILTLSLQLDPAADELVMVIADHGSGMDEATAAQMFDPFFTTKSMESGTGLGLATVYSHVEQMSGTIGAISTLGEGTEFTLRFPASSEGPTQQEESANDSATLNESSSATPSASSEAKAAVLLAEDNDLVRKVTQRVLERAGFEVHAVADGADAIARLEAADREAYCAVISDVIMPRIGGVEVLKWLHKNRPGIAVVLASGYTDDEIDAALLEETGAVLLPKPYAPDRLLECLQRLLQSRQPRGVSH